jgi:DNA-binding CsgD family transcriptional regulator
MVQPAKEGGRRRARRGARALVYERDALVAERARLLLAADGVAVCAVSDPVLFDDVARALEFDLYVVGVRDPAELEALRLARRNPLVLLAPLERPGAAGRLRLALPDARLVDRQLRDPGALRAAPAARAAEPEPPASDPVRRTFDGFGLSDRQLEVLSRALLGEPSAEIARRLFISEPTVRNHLHAIYERLGVSGRRELLGRFVRGLLEP